MLAFTNSRRCRWKQGDHRDETEGEQGDRGENLRERQASLPGQERIHWHRLRADRDPTGTGDGYGQGSAADRVSDRIGAGGIGGTEGPAEHGGGGYRGGG